MYYYTVYLITYREAIEVCVSHFCDVFYVGDTHRWLFGRVFSAHAAQPVFPSIVGNERRASSQ